MRRGRRRLRAAPAITAAAPASDPASGSICDVVRVDDDGGQNNHRQLMNVDAQLAPLPERPSTGLFPTRRLLPLGLSRHPTLQLRAIEAAARPCSGPSRVANLQAFDTATASLAFLHRRPRRGKRLV